jgi:hypothetical protein
MARFHVHYTDHEHVAHSIVVQAQTAAEATAQLKHRRNVKHIIGMKALKETEQQGDEKMSASDRISEFFNESNDLSDEAKERMTEMFKEAVDEKAAAVLASGIEDFLIEAVNERTEWLIETLDAYLTEELCEPFEAMESQHNTILKENTLLHDWLSETIHILQEQGVNISPEQVIQAAAERARQNAADGASSYSGRVAVDNSGRNKASVAGSGQRAAVGHQGLGDSAGAPVHEGAVDPRIQRYVDYMNGNNHRGGGLLSANPLLSSVATAPVQLSEAEVDKQYQGVRRADNTAKVMNQLIERRRLGLPCPSLRSFGKASSVEG